PQQPAAAAGENAQAGPQRPPQQREAARRQVPVRRRVDGDLQPHPGEVAPPPERGEHHREHHPEHDGEQVQAEGPGPVRVAVRAGEGERPRVRPGVPRQPGLPVPALLLRGEPAQRVAADLAQQHAEQARREERQREPGRVAPPAVRGGEELDRERGGEEEPVDPHGRGERRQEGGAAPLPAAGGQPGAAQARKSASVYGAARNRAGGESTSASPARFPVPGPPSRSASRRSATTATAPATSETSRPPTSSGSPSRASSHSTAGRPGKNASSG